jgi:hypothetical protein
MFHSEILTCWQGWASELTSQQCTLDADGGAAGALYNQNTEDLTACKSLCEATDGCYTASYRSSNGKCKLNAKCVTFSTNSNFGAYELTRGACCITTTSTFFSSFSTHIHYLLTNHN